MAKGQNSEEPHIRKHEASSEWLWAFFPLKRKYHCISQMTLLRHCFKKKKKKRRKSADPEDYNCIIASCSFPCISFSSHAAGFDTDLEDGWCEFSAIHILVQKENSLSVLRDNMSMWVERLEIANQFKQIRLWP